MVLVFSEEANRSKQVANELTLAMDSEVIVIPLKIDQSSPTGTMRFYLSGTHWLDAMNPPTERQILRLAETVKYTLGMKSADPRAILDEDKAFAESSMGVKLKRERQTKSRLLKRMLMVAAVSLGGLFAGWFTFFGPGAGIDWGAPQTPGDDSSLSIDIEGAPDLQEAVVVNSTEDSGEGSLRWALQFARSGDQVAFDPAVFPPHAPVTVKVKSELPALTQGNVTINAAYAGVIIDGSEIDGLNTPGLQIQSPDNVIMGLQIINFRDAPAVRISDFASNSIIGGDRTAGSGPVGQGNLLSGNGVGIQIEGERNTDNIITGNLIGTDLSGTSAHASLGNLTGVRITFASSKNIIGPGNIIAFNWGKGIEVIGSESHSNTITANSIFNNAAGGIYLLNMGNKGFSPPSIEEFDLEAGTVSGTAPPGSRVEIFSDAAGEGRIFEGSAEADSDGRFTFVAGRPLQGQHLTATATDEEGNTSPFSEPTILTHGD